MYKGKLNFSGAILLPLKSNVVIIKVRRGAVLFSL